MKNFRFIRFLFHPPALSILFALLLASPARANLSIFISSGLGGAGGLGFQTSNGGVYLAPYALGLGYRQYPQIQTPLQSPFVAYTQRQGIIAQSRNKEWAYFAGSPYPASLSTDVSNLPTQPLKQNLPLPLPRLLDLTPNTTVSTTATLH